MAFLRVKDPQGGEPRDVALRKPLVLIGRAAGNDVVLDDPALAPTHANLLRKGNHFTLSVIDRATTFLFQGMRARSTDLKVGDEVGFGRYFVTLMEGEPKSESRGPGPAPMNEVASLKRLVEFSRRLMSETSLEKVFALLLESVVEMSRAEKGFLIVVRDGERHLAASHNVGKETLDISRVSDSIVDKVIREQKAVIVSDAMHDAEFASARSVMELRLSSVMCVPLVYRNESLGALYLGNDSVRSLFQPTDLAVLEIWAGQASVLLNTALRLDELVLTNKNLREQLRQTGQGAMLGQSPAMKAVFTVLKKVGPKDISVLVTGETGTGKTSFARALHADGRGGALVEVALAGRDASETERLVADALGTASTIVLDDIGELPDATQQALLRQLKRREAEGRASRPMLVSTAQQPVAALQSVVRPDLFFRLAGAHVALPPLRSRRDRAALIETVLRELAGDRPIADRARAVATLAAAPWPGNLHELRSIISLVLATGDDEALEPVFREFVAADEDALRMPPASDFGRSAASGSGPIVEQAIDDLEQLLVANHWCVSRVARLLGVDRSTIHRRMNRFNLVPPQRRA